MADDDEKVVRVDFGRTAAPAKTLAPEDPTAPEKRAAFEQLIDLGLVLVNLDTRVSGVVVPASHRGEVQLGLNFSLRFFIDDFTWDDDGVRATLSFGGQASLCDIPWAAVFLMRSQVTQEAFLFPASVPPELAHMVEAAAAQAAEAPVATVAVVAASEEPGGDDGTQQGRIDDEDPPPDVDPPSGGGPRLKLVKS